MELDPKDFQFLSDTIKGYSGISLSEDKGYLLESRLLPIASKYGLKNLSELVAYTKENKDEPLLIEIIEAMTTNESFFFRDIKPFEYLTKTVIPAILKTVTDKKHLKIWSAACSTGQEPYSIAMAILEDPAFSDVNFEILATDIDYNVIEKAKEAVYTQFEVQRGMPINLMMKYFAQEDKQWKMKDAIREKVRFEKFNLLDNTGTLGKFDIVFCRNVLIYFNKETKEKVIHSLQDVMDTNTVLFLGSTENIMGIDTKLTTLKDKSSKILNGLFRLKPKS